MSAPKGHAPYTHKQPCWSCKNCYGGCSWTRKDPKPVPGCLATPTEKYFSNGRGRHGHTSSYAIHYCPEYIPDGTEDKT